MSSISFCVLGSGSSGNSIWISADGFAILIEAGFSRRETFRRLELRGIEPETIQAILVSHEHSDHCKGLNILASHLDVPVYMPELSSAEYFRYMGNKLKQNLDIRPFRSGEMLSLGPFLIETFKTPHDSCDSCGFVVWYKKTKMTLLTDLGHIPLHAVDKLNHSRLILLESNHDIKMLIEGRYPDWLKKRILSRHGHLSNDDLTRYITMYLNGWCEHFFLAHISKENNTPELAYFNAKMALEERNLSDTQLHLTSQDEPSEIIEIPASTL